MYERLNLQPPLQMLRTRLYNLQHSAQSQDPQVSSSLIQARLFSLSDMFDTLEGTGVEPLALPPRVFEGAAAGDIICSSRGHVTAVFLGAGGVRKI